MSGMQMVIFSAVISSFTPSLLMVFAMLNFAESAGGGGDQYWVQGQLLLFWNNRTG
jgi:hypothetical protein